MANDTTEAERVKGARRKLARDYLTEALNAALQMGLVAEAKKIAALIAEVLDEE